MGFLRLKSLKYHITAKNLSWNEKEKTWGIPKILLRTRTKGEVYVNFNFIFLLFFILEQNKNFGIFISHLNDNIFVFRTKEILFCGKVNFRLLSFVAILKILKMEKRKVLLVIS